MILSILITAIDEREDMLRELLRSLFPQCGTFDKSRLTKQITFGSLVTTIYTFPEVEIITAIDNKQITTGAKRNHLLQLAKGEYIIWCDDDDWIPSYYVKELLEAAKSDADCFAINGWITTNGKEHINWTLSKDNPNDTIKKNGVSEYRRTTNHITAVKRDIALKAGGFPDKSNAEDKAYSEAILPYLKTEFKIIPPMYHYRYSTIDKSYK